LRWRPPFEVLMGAQVVVPDSKLVEPLLVQFPALAAEA